MLLFLVLRFLTIARYLTHLKHLHTMNKLGIIIGLVFFVLNMSYSQDGNFPTSKKGTGTVFGKAVEADTEEGLAFANVSIYTKGEKQPVASKNTSDAGRFIFRDIPYGHYILEISFLGMGNYVSDDFVLDKDHTVMQLGSIYLSTSSNELDEINVTGSKTTEQISLVKKVFNVNENINNAGGSALDAMRNIPALFVGIDGDVQLRGSSNVKFLVNGRPSSLTGSGGELNLEQIPTASIEAIEVITNPSAKYAASGKTGIINIILKKPNDHGLNYSYNFMAGNNDKWTTGLSLNYRTKKWNWRAGYQFDRKNDWYTKDLNQQSFLVDTTYFLEETSTADKLKMGHTANLGFDWNPTNKITLFTTVTVNPHIGQKTSVFDYTFYNQAHIYDNNSLRKTQDDEEMMGMQAELGLDKKFSRKGMKWNSVYSFDNGTKADSILSVHDYLYQNNLLSIEQAKNQREQLIQTHRLQSDFTYPFSKDVNLETGMVYSLRYLDNDFSYFDKVGSDWKSNAGRTNDFVYDEQITAGYLMSTARIKKWDLNAGIRVENTDVVSKLANASQVYPNNYTNFFPSGHIGYAVFPKGKGNIMLTYSRRIKRPSYKRLNPFASYNDNQNIRRGNPLLKPELTDSWEIGWQSRWKKGSISPAIFYRKTIDKIGYYTHILDSGIRELTFVNLNSSTSQGAELNGSYSPTSKVRLSGNLSYFFVEKDGDNLENKATNKGDMWMARLMVSLKPTKKVSLQISSFYHSGFIGILGRSKPITSVDAGLTYRAFQKRGKFILKVSDVFNTRRFAMDIKSSDLIMDFERKRESRIFWLGFNWDLKQDKHKKRRRRKHSEGGGMEM